MGEKRIIRTFIAIELPAVILDKIRMVQTGLKKTIHGMIRWVRPENIHLTLKFLGDVSLSDIESIKRAMALKTIDFPPFNLEVRGLGSFPDVTRPRVIWLGINGDTGALLAMQKEIDEELSCLGFPKDDRPFRPHLTLGRVKVSKGIIGLARAVEDGGTLAAGTFGVEKVIMFKSELLSQGAIYKKLAVFPLEN